ncbi:MAG: hypothetical protein H6717_14515 [Polyangiaceae bacterium]|nr:hypothetical protein [Polyangiaceae bacterium]
MKRRRFIALVGAGAVVGGTGIALVRAGGYSVPDHVKLQVLAPWQYVVLSAFGARVLAPEGAPVAEWADEYLVDMADADRTDLLRLLGVVEHVMPLVKGYFRRFSALSSREQDDVLAALEQSPVGLLRGGFQALKALSMMALYRRPESWAAIGYDGPVVKWDKS